MIFPLEKDCGYYDLRDYEQKRPGGVRLVRKRQNGFSTSKKGLLHLHGEAEFYESGSF